MPTTHTHYVPRPPVDEQPLTPNTLRAAASTLIFGRRPSATRLSTAAQLPENTIQSILEFLDDDALATLVAKLKDFGRVRSGIDFHDEIGWNHKFSDVQAVIGIEQMKKLPWRVKRMREISNLYKTELAGVAQVEMMDHEVERQPEWIPWFIDIYVDDRDALAKHLKAAKVGSRASHNLNTRAP